MTHPYQSEAKNWLRLEDPINSWRRSSSLRHFLQQLNEASAKCVRGARLIKRLALFWGKHGAQAVIFGPKMENNSQPYIPSKAPDSWIFITFQFGVAELKWAAAGGWMRGGHWPSTLASHQPLHRLVCQAFLPFDSQSRDRKALVYPECRVKVAISILILAKSVEYNNHIQEHAFHPWRITFLQRPSEGHVLSLYFSTSRQDKRSHSH